MKSNAFKYRYELQQIGKATIELFGTDSKLSNDELELKRRQINREHFPVYVSAIFLVNQKTGKFVAFSRNSKLPPEPLFEVAA